MKIVLCCIFATLLCLCEHKGKEAKAVFDLRIELKKKELSKNELIRLFEVKNVNEKYLKEIINDTAYKDVYRRTIIFYICQTYLHPNISFSELRDQFKYPTWLKKENVHILNWYVGPKPVFLNDSTSGIIIYLEPRLPKTNTSRIYFKIGIDRSYKAEPITEELIFNYLTGNYEKDNIDSLRVTSVQCDEKGSQN